MMAFDPAAYWQHTAPPVYPEHAAQEAALVNVLRDLDFGSVLEVGCGDGRVTSLLAGLTREPITVLDVNAERVASTIRRVPGTIGVHSNIVDFSTDQRWDLVIAVEVLMHVPPEDIEAACDNLRRLSARWIVTCDWTEPLPAGKERAEHNWLYDYARLLSPTRSVRVGRQTIHVTRSEAVA